MRLSLAKVFQVVASIAIAYGVIYLLVRILRAIGTPWAYQAAYWVSPLSFTGWLLALAVGLLAYLLIRRLSG
jgi:hypothetical protein